MKLSEEALKFIISLSVEYKGTLEANKAYYEKRIQKLKDDLVASADIITELREGKKDETVRSNKSF